MKINLVDGEVKMGYGGVKLTEGLIMSFTREYKIVTSSDHNIVSGKVTEMLMDGWDLVGGLTTAGSSSVVLYSQAMYKLTAPSISTGPR